MMAMDRSPDNEAETVTLTEWLKELEQAVGDLDVGDVWTGWIVVDEHHQQQDERDRRRNGVKVHIVPNSALSTSVSKLPASSVQDIGETKTTTIQRRRDLWPCIPKVGKHLSEEEEQWNWLRRRCLEGKEVKCLLVFDSNRSGRFSVQAVMRALHRVDTERYGTVARRKAARLWSGEPEMERRVEVRLCVLEDMDREIDKRGSGEERRKRRVEWRRKLDGEYRERLELDWRRVVDVLTRSVDLGSLRI
jgi:hypothetical protein